jgi:hypothetical protein
MWRLLRRIGNALSVLFLPGDRMPVTRFELLELRRDWDGWQQTFTQTLEKLNAWYARQAAREKRALERELKSQVAASGASATTDKRNHKLELSRRFVAGQGGVLPLPRADLASPEPPPLEEADE